MWDLDFDPSLCENGISLSVLNLGVNFSWLLAKFPGGVVKWGNVIKSESRLKRWDFAKMEYIGLLHAIFAVRGVPEIFGGSPRFFQARLVLV